MSEPQIENNAGNVPVSDLIPFMGCVCCVTSCYLDYPELIGCAGKRICLCCYSDFMACKLPKEGENVWCHWEKGYTYLAPIDTNTLCMQRAQMFCLDVRCAIPFSDDIPQLVTLCFFTLFFKGQPGPYQFYKTVKELDALAAAAASAAPAAAPAAAAAPAETAVDTA